MNRIIWLVILSLVFAVGCAKRAEKPVSQLPEETVIDETIDLEKQIAQTLITEEPKVPQERLPATAILPETAPAPQQAATAFVKPTNEEIQQALKNAGLYQYKVDGIMGVKTKKAIEDFQAQNNLKVDGKVGPKTWEKMKPYLTQTPKG